MTNGIWEHHKNLHSSNEERTLCNANLNYYYELKQHENETLQFPYNLVDSLLLVSVFFLILTNYLRNCINVCTSESKYDIYKEQLNPYGFSIVLESVFVLMEFHPKIILHNFQT